MPGGLGHFGKLNEDEETEKNFKMSKYIQEMDDELKNQFKALKALQDMLHDADEEEQKEVRKLELEYEEKYKEIYIARDLLINGELELDP